LGHIAFFFAVATDPEQRKELDFKLKMEITRAQLEWGRAPQEESVS
jgi:hypothetical protein